MTKVQTGRCLCGSVTFSYKGDENWRAHCHCESCRRQTASPFTTFMGVTDGNWQWTGQTPQSYISSPGVERNFCGSCGTPVAFNADTFPDEIHFYASLLDDHKEFEPRGHVHWEERVPWITLADTLPRK